MKGEEGGLVISESKRLKALEDENRRLKKLLAKSMLNSAAPKELSRKVVDPVAKGEAISHQDGVPMIPVGHAMRHRYKELSMPIV